MAKSRTKPPMRVTPKVRKPRTKESVGAETVRRLKEFAEGLESDTIDLVEVKPSAPGTKRYQVRKKRPATDDPSEMLGPLVDPIIDEDDDEDDPRRLEPQENN